MNIIKYWRFKNKVLNVPDVDPDPRDWPIALDSLQRIEADEGLKEYSRRTATPPVKNQGSIGSCVGHSGRVVYGDTQEFAKKEPSPMWIYKKGKKYDPFPGEDYSGTTIRGACSALLKVGCCEETYWPDTKSEDAPMLTGAEENAIQYKTDAYYVIESSNHKLIKRALLHEPLWTSFKVHYNFYYTPSSGIVKSDGYLESKLAGGHAVAMVGWKYINDTLYWQFQNSWGTRFGDDGFFFMEASLYEKVLINSIGPYYLAVKSEKGHGKFLNEEEERKKREEEQKKKEDKKKNKKKKSMGIAVGVILLVGFVYSLT